MADISERTLLLKTSSKSAKNGLSLAFAIICIVDVFGVFPVVALPKAIINCGFYGILVVLTVCCLQMYTATLLGRCWVIANSINSKIENKSRYPYAALAEITWGKSVSKFATVLLDVTVFGAGIPNLIVASQNMQLLGLRLTGNTFNISFCYWILVMGIILCPVLWLGSPKDMKLLCTLSVCLVISVFVLVWSIIVFDSNEIEIPPDTITPSFTIPLWHKILSAYGILSFQFDIHPTILTIHVDMKEKNKIGKAVFGGFCISLSMFALTCIAASIRYGNSTRASLLETLPSSVFLHFAALLVAIQLGLSSAVGNSALYQHMEDCMDISREFNHKRCILRTSLTILAILLAESVPRFDLVMSLIGGTLTGPLVFILPPLFYIKILQLKNKHEESIRIENMGTLIKNPVEVSISDQSNTDANVYEYKSLQINTGTNKNIGEILEKCFCAIIIIVGACTTIATTYVNVINTIQFASFSQPCILNITSATLFIGT